MRHGGGPPGMHRENFRQVLQRFRGGGRGGFMGPRGPRGGPGGDNNSRPGGRGGFGFKDRGRDFGRGRGRGSGPFKRHNDRPGSPQDKKPK